ncbi:hypothetical protein HZS_5792 [Henneguya salminicola]|nr:hypothetical protein HZS_5792 [Henneguya salminicola]
MKIIYALFMLVVTGYCKIIPCDLTCFGQLESLQIATPKNIESTSADTGIDFFISLPDDPIIQIKLTTNKTYSLLKLVLRAANRFIPKDLTVDLCKTRTVICPLEPGDHEIAVKISAPSFLITSINTESEIRISGREQNEDKYECLICLKAQTKIFLKKNTKRIKTQK